MANKKKKVVVEETFETGLKIRTSQYGDITQAADPEDSWSRDSTHTSWTVEAVEPEPKYPDVTACFPVPEGTTVYLLYLVYSTGDSFGHDEDGRIAFVDVWTTREKAEAAATIVREHADWYKGVNTRWSPMTKEERLKYEKKFDNAYQVTVIRENGEPLQTYASWNGYFESVSYIEVASFVVNQNARKRY